MLEGRDLHFGASLGPELASQGLLGTLWGVILVFGFMSMYYRRPGLVACAALVFNGKMLFHFAGILRSLPKIAKKSVPKIPKIKATIRLTSGEISQSMPPENAAIVTIRSRIK